MRPMPGSIRMRNARLRADGRTGVQLGRGSPSGGGRAVRVPAAASRTEPESLWWAGVPAAATRARPSAQEAHEPVAGQGGGLLQGAGLLEQVGGAGDDLDGVLAGQLRGRLLVE